MHLFIRMPNPKYTVTKLAPSLSLITNDARKRSWVSPGEDSDIKAPESYFYQHLRLVNNLAYLNALIATEFSSSPLYLEASFFPNMISPEYLSILNTDAGIVKIRNSNIWSNNTTEKYYFEITNKDLLIQYLSINLEKLDDYISKRIDKPSFTNRRIILWKYFKLITNQNKKDTIALPTWQLRLQIEAIRAVKLWRILIPLERLGLLSGATILWWDTDPDSLFLNKTIDFEWGDIDQINNWITDVAWDMNIWAIRLDHFMSSVENVIWWWVHSKIDINISVPTTLPTIAVIDSGIAINVFTRDIVTDIGLDFTNKSDPSGWNPFIDTLGHWTAVASVIAYGETLESYLLKNEIDTLIPVCRIFPVKVFGDKSEEHIEYAKIFQIGWLLWDQILAHNIKLINISLWSAALSTDDFDFSEQSKLIDAFSEYYNVLCVVASWNIRKTQYEFLNATYPDLSFYNSKSLLARQQYPELINATAPSELLSGLSVWSLFEWRPALHSRSFPKIARWSSLVPNILSVWWWDFEIDWAGNIIWSKAIFTCCPDESKLVKDVWTSFATPRITRTISIANSIYPDLSISSLKWLILHKTSNVTAKKTSQISWKRVAFHAHFLWDGTYNTNSEIDFLKDGNNEKTFIFEWVVRSKEVIGFPISIFDWLRSSIIPMDNKICLKLSLCIIPSVKDWHWLKSNNIFHAAAIMHSKNISPIYTKITEHRTLPNQMIPNDTVWVILSWTNDYYGAAINPTYSESEKNFTKAELLSFLWGDEEVMISVRWLSNIRKETSFSVVVSIEDKGATGQLRANIQATATVQ